MNIKRMATKFLKPKPKAAKQHLALPYWLNGAVLHGILLGSAATAQRPFMLKLQIARNIKFLLNMARYHQSDVAHG
jgi:hypothetical protein